MKNSACRTSSVLRITRVPRLADYFALQRMTCGPRGLGRVGMNVEGAGGREELGDFREVAGVGPRW